MSIRFPVNLKPTFFFKAGLVLALTWVTPFPTQAGNVDAILKAFESNKGYVQPFATLFGSMTNSGWYQSSAVPEGFGFYLGLPINLTTVSDEDRSFSWNAIDTGCVAYHKNTPGTRSQVCQENSSYDAPTLLGRKKGPVTFLSIYNQNSNTIIDTIEIPLSDGKSEVSSFNWFPFLSPQLSFSYKYTELKLRYIGLPLDAYSFSMPAVGLQHDLASVLPPLPVSISVAANFTWLSASWTPGENISGSMDLSGQSQFYGILAGYTYKNWLEIFVETGWESASLKSSGSLVIHDPSTVNPEPDEIVKPHLTLEGRNGFRAGLNIAFHLGYDAVFGQNLGAELGNQVSVLAYRYKK